MMFLHAAEVHAWRADGSLVRVARLVALEVHAVPRMPGGWEHRIWIADDFDAPLPSDLSAMFGA
ncbi:MAG TPA: hypothetical protein VFK02_34010 [Kofleriaceae bacterium]|nr:hypothetical protein [Kofleriaceae bacterium]